METSELTEDGLAPAGFEFVLDRWPALLILRSETRQGTSANSLLGGFLARLAPDQNGFPALESARRRIAA